MSFKSLKSARTLTRHIGIAAFAAAICVAAARAETPDYFVEYAEPSAYLYVDTGIIGKSGTRVQIRAANFGGGEILIGARHTDSVRFEPVRFWGEQSGMKYANDSYHQTVFSPYYGDWIYDHAVSSAGVLTATVTDCGAGGNNGSTSHDWGTAINTETTMYIFGSHYRSDTEDKPVDQNLRRVYYCKIWQEDGNGGWTLVRDLRPCVKDGVVGFYDAATGYDALNGTVFYPQGGGLLKGGNLVYDTVATWNGGTTPTAADLATAANWSCADANGTAIASVVPGKTSLAVLPSGIALPAGYEVPWAATKVAGTLTHPVTLWGREAFSGDRKSYKSGGVRSWQWRDDGLQHYVARGVGDVSYINQNGNKPAELQHAQFRYDGWFNVSAEQAGEWTLSQAFDDYFGLRIDGNWVLSYNSYSGGQNTTWTATAGWHRFTMIAGDTWGGWGAAKSVNGTPVPFTIATPNYNSGATFKFSDLEFGSGTNTITLSANTDWSALGTLALCDGTVIDLNGCQLTITDAIVDGYIGAKFVNSNSKKAILLFMGEPSASTALKYSLIDGVGTKILLTKAGEQSATWTGAANNGNALDANNWEDTLTGEAVVPTANYAVTIAGTAVNVQIPDGSTFACKSFSIGNCTFTADCDWRGLSVKPTIVGTANLNGHNLNIKRLSASSSSEFANSVAGTVSEVRFDVESGADVFGEEGYIENAANLKTAENARIVLVKGTSDISANVLKIGDASGIYADFVQTDGTVTMGNSAESRIGGWLSGNKGNGTYTMYGGSLTVGSSLHVGGYGTGEFTQHGGTVTLNSFFAVGRFGGSTGTYVITNGTLTVMNETEIGMDGGTGRFDICGDARVDLKSLVMPIERGNANLRIADNASLTMTGLTIGRGYGTSDTKGYFTQDGGTVEIGGDATIGRTGIGHYTMTGGRLHATGNFYVGHSWSGANGGDGLFSISGDAVAELDKGIILGNNRTPGKLSLSGGTLFTPSIKKGSNTATVTFDGGTVVATNVTDGANFFNGISNLQILSGGVTLDTAGYGVTMAADVLASAESTFTKTGSGTLTVAAVPPVGNMVVSNGTLALSASYDNALMLTHRWSFNGEGNDYTDSITSTSASTFGDDATKRATTGGKLVLRGNGAGSASLNLGKGLLGLGDATVEIWASNDAAKHYARVFDYGNGSWGSNPGQTDCFLFVWSTGTDATKDIVQLKKNNTAVINKSGTMSVMELGKQYYFAFTFKANGDGSTTVKWVRRDASTGALELHDEATVSDWTLATLFAKNPDFWLGVSKYSGDSDANASYDEVRIWNGALTDDAIALSAQKGPDATAADLAEIVAASPAARTLTLAGGTLDLGGNTLTQPNLMGNGGTVRNGTLTVTDTIRINVGDSIFASGTIDLTNAKVELFDPENLTTGFYFIKAAPSATLSIVGKPEATNLPTGWQISVTSSGAKIQKVGFSIFLR